MATDALCNVDDEAGKTRPVSPPRIGLSFLRSVAVPVTESVQTRADPPSLPTTGSNATTPEPAAAGPSQEPTEPGRESSGTKRKQRASLVPQKWRQRKLSFTREPCLVDEVADNEGDNEEEEDLTSSEKDPEVAFTKAHRRYTNSWQGLFPWLVLSRADDGFPILKCSTCMEFGAENANTAYGKGGAGGRDMQKQSIRTHQRSTAHLDAHGAKKATESRKLRQAMLDEYEGLDKKTLHLIAALKTAVFTCQSEAPISSYIGFIKFMLEMGCPNLPVDQRGSYYSK
ncbi:unnamed protein product [Closterium sp. Yama58-4]|nr:unnamed protein product [Closterium sp. Yama58-4]